jgi:hypothetical protein
MAGEQSDPTNEQIAQVLAEHGRKAAVWDHFNLVILTDGKKRRNAKVVEFSLRRKEIPR